MRNAVVRLFGIVAALVLAQPASAQMANLPASVQAKIAEIGPVLNPEMIESTIALLRPVVEATPRTGLRITADAAYGSDPREKLDVYEPEKPHKNMPVVIFVHGGGYVRGDKNSYGPIYGNVAAFFARNGMLGVNATYRLAPKDPWPAGGEDVGRMVAWAKANAKTFGSDPNRIFLFGHSAGATHVASYVFDRSLQPKSGVGVAGAILLSGLYRVTEKDTASNIKAYFGEDAAKLAARSPVTHVNESKVPLLIATAEYDPVFLGTPSYDLASLVCVRDGKCPRFIWLKGHNHISEAASFDTKDRELGRAIVDFIHAGK